MLLVEFVVDCVVFLVQLLNLSNILSLWPVSSFSSRGSAPLPGTGTEEGHTPVLVALGGGVTLCSPKQHEEMRLNCKSQL